MKFDLHCHTKEGSIDSTVSVKEFARMFSTLGYGGFMIADHNSYKGCKAWDEIKDDPQYSNICVIRGLEYDTKDAGHVLVIMPDDMYLNLFTIRGMKCSRLIRSVHHMGGILGLAHPFGVPSSSAMGFKKMNMDLIGDMDFVETFNTCESQQSNELAGSLAEKYSLPGFAGSDSHVERYIGMACTEIDADIHCNNDLIAAVKDGVAITAGGVERPRTTGDRFKHTWFSNMCFRIYNRGIGKLQYPHRKFYHKKLWKDPAHARDHN